MQDLAWSRLNGSHEEDESNITKAEKQVRDAAVGY